MNVNDFLIFIPLDSQSKQNREPNLNDAIDLNQGNEDGML